MYQATLPSGSPGTFSIAIATYNGARHLQEQLDSIAAQTLLPIEIQVGDDGSSDATGEIVAAFAERVPFPVVFHRNARNLGYGENFLQAARRCRGDWIAFCDQDDVWLPHKLETCARALKSVGDPDVLMIVHGAEIVGEDLTPTGRRISEKGEVRDVLGHHLLWSHYGFAQLFSRRLVTEIATRPRIPTKFLDIDRYPHDVWISSLGNVLGKTIHLAESLALYRRHERTTTETGKGNRGSPLATSITTGAAEYRHLSTICGEAAECIDHHREAVLDTRWKERMEAGAAAYRRLSEAYARRGSIYDSDRLTARMRAVAGLAAKGYRGLGGSSFGWRSLAKDVVMALAGDWLARRGAAK